MMNESWMIASFAVGYVMSGVALCAYCLNAFTPRREFARVNSRRQQEYRR